MKRILLYISLGVSAAIGILVVKSYARPVTTDFSTFGQVWVHVRGDLARCRIIILIPTLSRPTSDQAYMLERYKSDLRADPRTARLGAQNVWVCWPGNETTARGVRLNFSLFIPLIIFAAPLVLPLWRSIARRYPPRAVCAEIWQPSEIVVSRRRAPHRILIVAFILLGVVWCLPWLATGIDGPWLIGQKQGFNICSTPGEVTIALHPRRSLQFLTGPGSRSIVYAFEAPPDHERGDFEYRLGPFTVQRAARPASAGSAPGLMGFISQPTSDGILSISGPPWAVSAVFILLLLYPVIAAFRGPLRRAHRLSSMTCRRCGYNLTGLPTARCPECGMSFGVAA